MNQLHMCFIYHIVTYLPRVVSKPAECSEVTICSSDTRCVTECKATHTPPTALSASRVSGIIRAVDPLLVLERLLSIVGEIDVILVHQAAASSVLLRRYAQRMVVLVQPPHPKSKGLWSPTVPKTWAPLLMAHWRVVDLIYTHIYRSRQAAALDSARAASTIAAAAARTFFDQFRYAASHDGSRAPMDPVISASA
jgi:hypothetical protein